VGEDYNCVSLGPSTAGRRVFDQIVDVVERDVVDRALDLEHPGRCVSHHGHDRGLDRRAAFIDAGNFLDGDRDVFRNPKICRIQ
jgi:hypothetical protein